MLHGIPSPDRERPDGVERHGMCGGDVFPFWDVPVKVIGRPPTIVESG